VKSHTYTTIISLWYDYSHLSVTQNEILAVIQTTIKNQQVCFWSQTIFRFITKGRSGR